MACFPFLDDQSLCDVKLCGFFQGIPIEAPVYGMFINVAKEDDNPVDIDIPLVLEFECLEFPFVSDFKGVNMLLFLSDE